jgi:pimeloyl-ACP methyl ester carboxylesterase
MTISATQQYPTKHYTWRNYRCAYQIVGETQTNASQTPLLLIHPIGVGLSGKFWQRFCQSWQEKGYKNPIYNPDLIGCGDSAMPHLAYYPIDWAEQLNYFIETVIQQPVILVVQGALFPVAIKLVGLQNQSNTGTNWVEKLVLSGPPPWPLMIKEKSSIQQKLQWNLFFDSLVGNGFYRYARSRKFLSSFSTKRLFAYAEAVDEEWLTTLGDGAKSMASRYAVFSFLAGFWRENYQEQIAAIQQPTLVVMGEKASSISKEGKAETADQRLAEYLKYLPHGEGVKISGSNVLPYESTDDFVQAIAPFIHR